MKKYFHGKIRFGIVLIMSLAALPRAATITTWQTGGTEASSTNQTKITIQGMACRIDSSPTNSYLLDGASGYVYRIYHPAKVYRRQPLAEFAALSPCAGTTNAPLPTGQSQTIGGYQAFEYRLDLPCGSHVFWVAPDYPGWQKFQAENAAATAFAVQAGFHTFSQSLPGMVVKSENVVTIPASGDGAYADSVLTNIATLVSAAIVANDPAVTNLIAEYREIPDLSSAAPLTPGALAVPPAIQEARSWARLFASPNLPRMGSLSNQFQAGFAPQIAFDPAVGHANSPQSLGVGAPSLANDPPPPGGTYMLAFRSWGQHAEQVQEIVVTNPARADMLWSNLHNRVYGSVGRATFGQIPGFTNAAGLHVPWSGTLRHLPPTKFEGRPTIYTNEVFDNAVDE